MGFNSVFKGLIIPSHNHNHHNRSQIWSAVLELITQVNVSSFTYHIRVRF